MIKTGNTTLPEEQEGFKRMFMNIGEIPKELFCSICSEVFKDPTRVKCGHTFCLRCIETSKKKKCPSCGRNSALKTKIKNFIVKRIVNDLVVECPKNCGKNGSLQNIENHFKVCRGKVEVDPLKESLKRMNCSGGGDEDFAKEAKRGKGNLDLGVGGVDAIEGVN